MTKRSHGEGSIQPRGNAWRIRYRINGKRFEKTVQGSRSDAAKALRDALKAGDDGRHIAPNKITFAQWAKDWLALKGQKAGARTIESYEGNLRLHVLPVIGALPLQRITATDIDKLYGGITLAPKTMGLIHIIVKSCFRTAVKKKLLAANPVEDAEKPNDEDQEVGTVLEEEELARLVKGFEGTSLYPIVAVAAYTGARRNEILALRWVDVELDKATISITRSIEQTKAHGRRVKGPKKAKHARTIQIDEGLCELLRKEKDRHLRLVAGVPDGAEVDLSLVKLPPEALIFPAIDSPRWPAGSLTDLRSPKSITQMFRDHADKLGFPIRFHDLRGTHETILLDKGVPVHTVAKRCGHDPAMLLRVYAKRTKKSDANAANVIGTLTRGVL